MPHTTYKALFERYRDDSLIQKAVRYSRWTVASIMADLERAARSGTRQDVERDFQGMGALLVNNLSAKLASLLFPTSRPFFRVSLSEELKTVAEQAGLSQAEIASSLARMEMDACQQLFKNASYNQLVIALKHLIVTGNVLLFRDSAASKTVAYGLQAFALRRDGRGVVQDCVLREYVDFNELDPKFQKQLRIRYQNRSYEGHDATLELYTRIKRERKGKKFGYEVSQEIEGLPVGKPGYYPEHACPWQFPTWNLVAGEHYGRGLVEDFAGDFAKLSELSEALALYEVESMKIVNLVTPGSGTDIDELAGAESGEWVAGTPDSVNFHESGSAQKIDAIQRDLEQVFSRLARAFMYTANTRDAERVTAYEIRRDALEAENVLGGVYSSLAEGMQVPMAPVLLLEVNPGALQGIITEDVKLDVMAGIPALGRSVDVQNILAAAQELAAIAPALAQIDPRIDMTKLADLVYAGRSVDTTLLFKSDEQMAEEAEAQQAQAMAEQQMMGAQAMADQQQAMSNLQVQ